MTGAVGGMRLFERASRIVILRRTPMPRAKSDHALRPCFLMGIGRSRAAATPVLTQSVTVSARTASKVDSLSGR